MPKIVVSPKKWAWDRGKDESRREGTYLRVMVKLSVLLWDNGKPQMIVLQAPVCALPETSINQVLEVLTKFYRMFAEIFKESYRVHTFPEVATPQQR